MAVDSWIFTGDDAVVITAIECVFLQERVGWAMPLQDLSCSVIELLRLVFQMLMDCGVVFLRIHSLQYRALYLRSCADKEKRGWIVWMGFLVLLKKRGADPFLNEMSSLLF